MGFVVLWFLRGCVYVLLFRVVVGVRFAVVLVVGFWLLITVASNLVVIWCWLPVRVLVGLRCDFVLDFVFDVCYVLWLQTGVWWLCVWDSILFVLGLLLYFGVLVFGWNLYFNFIVGFRVRFWLFEFGFGSL